MSFDCKRPQFGNTRQGSSFPGTQKRPLSGAPRPALFYRIRDVLVSLISVLGLTLVIASIFIALLIAEDFLTRLIP